MQDIVLLVGDLAYYDSLVGLIPIKIVGIDKEDNRNIICKITCNFNTYRKGEYITLYKLNIVPRNMIRVKCGIKYIKAYSLIIVDDEEK